MIQARAVGNAVFVERQGMSGDYCSFGLSDFRAACDVADAINRAIRDAVAAVEEEADALTDTLASELVDAEAKVVELEKKLKGCKCKKADPIDLSNMTAKGRG